MFSSICVTYAVGRRIKDSVVSVYLGVEAINAIKLFYILPIIFLTMFFYQKITLNANDNYRNKLRYYMNIPFIMYFLFFGIIEFAGLHTYMSEHTINLLPYGKYLPQALQGIFFQLVKPLLHIWDTMFYVLVELYGTLILSFSFWQFVNSYTTREDAKSLYPYYVTSASISMIISSLTGYMVNKVISNLSSLHCINLYNVTYDSLFHSLNIFVMIIAVLVSILSYKFSLKSHLLDYEGSTQQSSDKKSKKVMSLSEALSKITHNKIVLYMGACVLCYMILINLVEVSWKKRVFNYYRIHQNNPIGMTNLYNMSQFAVGIISIVGGVIAKFMLQRSWLLTSLVTPILVGFMGLVFLISSILLPKKGIMFGVDAVFIPVLLGSIQNAFAKSSKYTFFDTTKETSLLYIPKQLRDGSKGAIDMICSRLGKSTGGILQLGLITLLVPPNQISIGLELIAPYITIMVTILSLTWIYATVMTNKSINSVVKNPEQ
jgi:AAA family ATP:ADP antiporter